MKRSGASFLLIGVLFASLANAQQGQSSGQNVSMTFVSLGLMANAVIAEPPATDAERNHLPAFSGNG